ncbi:hypothetical protein AWZ03_013774 [Drosophila navojoa]|uniref:Ionotropic glutamate receptor C-terminal domain-containing protein n=1 Tax=Drosophila navojoa TaxID=7232 RepID=A0A484ATW8_DRONA|nr:uncharacterized protein LOC115564968 [Drosophila navojoa]TDG39803.1 hypothetical protein AWZ03_013774 [Drosophila navojoa]
MRPSFPKVAQRRLQLLIWLLQLPIGGQGIVNPSNESANMVVYMLPAKDVGPRTWKVGVDCLDSFSQIFFYRNPLERFTRSYNLMLTNVFNMSLPADLIQQGFSQRINEAISDLDPQPGKQLFQLRVISDHFNTTKFFGELLLADNYVIVVDSVERLHRLMSHHVSKSRSWNPGARFLVLFYNAQMWERPWTVASQIFNDLMSNFYVHRVALIFSDSPSNYNLLVNDYYSNVDCRVLSVQSVGQCKDGQLFPSAHAVHVAMSDYISGFSPRNCTFYVCAAIAAPFVEEDCILGIEMRILGFMRNRLQFLVNQTCTRDTRGEVDEVGKWNGLLGKLEDGECDFIMGGFYPDNEVVGIFWGSDCYLQDAHTWFTKLADRRPAWQAMVGIFRPYTWICFLLVLLLSWLCWYSLVWLLPEPQYFQPLSLTGINALAVSICIAVQERPVCESTRVFFVMLTLYGVNVVAIYTSKMISTFQDPGHLHQIDTLKELVVAGVPFGGEEESRDWFENDDDLWIFKAYNSSPEFRPRTQNLRFVQQGQRCILSSRMYIMQNLYADDIYAFPQNVFVSPMQLIMKAGFPFLYEMNMIIRYMRDVGIIQKIDSDFRYNNTYLNRISKMRPDFAATVIVLTTEHLKGPFGILIVGICCAMLTFLVELLCGYTSLRRRQRRTRRRSKWRRERQQLHRAVAPVVRFTPVKRRKVL